MKRILYTLLIVASGLAGHVTVHAQSPMPMGPPVSSSLPDSGGVGSFNMGLFPREEPVGLKKVSLSGFYRFFGTYTHMKTPYVLNPIIADTSLEHSLFIGDDQQLPSFLINVAGRPSEKAAWGFDVFAFQFMEGNIGQAYSQQIADSLLPSNQSPLGEARLAPTLILNLGINLYGAYETDFGVFNVKAGGIHWHALSDLTFGSFQGYNRFTLFERNPWDPVERGTHDRYSQYFNQGEISQDTRWGNRAFTGIILEGVQLPHDLSFSAMYGKSEINGGFLTTPNLSYGGKVKKDFERKQFIAINTFNSGTWADSLALERVGFNIITGEFRVNVGDFRLHMEAGTGRYESPEHSEGWEELFSGKLLSPKIANRLQFELHAFRIDQSIVNNVSTFINSSVSEYVVNEIPAGQVGSNAVLQPTGSAVVPLGMMTNNRQGINLNASFEVGDLHGAIGFGGAGEIEARANQISYGNPVNRLTRSRFWRFLFPQNVGPYNRYSVIFRDTYQTINLSDDSSGVAVNKKYFSTLETQLKYKTRLFNRELYGFFLGQYQSVQQFWTPFIVTTEEAYLRSYSSELELYYCLTDNVNLSSYLGYERSIANFLTDIDEVSRRPRNQTGRGLGMGIDISLGRNSRLYLRHRWFDFEDRSFADDRFNGTETVLEIKTSF